MNFHRSLGFKFLIGFILMFIPLLFFLLYNNLYAMNVVRNQVASTNNSLLSPYVDQIDNTLMEIGMYLSYKADNDFDINTWNYYRYGSTDYTLTRVAIVNKFTTDMYLNNNLDALFVYKSSNRDLALVTKNHFYEKQDMIESQIDGLVRNYEDKSWRNWALVQSGTGYYLTQLVKVNKDVYVGSWIDVSQYAAPLNPATSADTGKALLLSTKGVPLTGTQLSASLLEAVHTKITGLSHGYETLEDGKQKYLMVGKISKVADIFFVKLIPEELMFKDLIFFQRAIYLLPFGAVLFLLLLLLFMRRLFMNPLSQLIGGMRKIGQGKLDVRLTPDSTNEFAFLAQSFNKMAQEIEDLTINVYEEKLLVKQAEFKHLQVQINPHFYMNCLNLIYNMAVLEDYPSVKKLSLHLAEYFRFIIKTNGKSISLQEEMEHIRNYLDIQSLRFEHRLTYEIELPEELESFSVPPLIVQPFVENAIIHGFKKTKQPFRVEIRVSRDLQSPERMRVTIVDNGIGFPAELLSQLQSGSYTNLSDNAHIGIWNVIHRLEIQYGSNTWAEFFNQEDNGGAGVRIYLPMQLD